MKSGLFLSIALFSLGSLLTNCGGGNVELDNSGDLPLEVVIGNDRYTMAPGSYKSVSLDPGTHHIVVYDPNQEILYNEDFE